MSALHKLVCSQLAKATQPSGKVDSQLLCELMSTCYEELELDRKRVDRASRIMQEELTHLTVDMTRLIEELRLQNLYFKAALDNMSQGLCLLDVEGRLIVVNERFLQMYGLAAHIEMSGRSMADVLVASPLVQSANSYLALASTRMPGTLHQELSNGRTILIAHEPLPDGGYLDTFKDVTDRVRAEARLVLATEGGNIGLWEGRLDGTQAWFSDQFWAMLGYAPTEMVPAFDTVMELVHEEDRPRLVETILSMRAAQSAAIDLEYRMLGRDGSHRWIQSKGRVVEREADGRALRVAGVSVDVTERKESERRLVASERLESIGQLAAGVAHEINTPVQYVNDSVYFIREGVHDLLEKIAKLRNDAPAACAPDEDLVELQQELPPALDRVADGLSRVAEIVSSMKDFAHPDNAAMTSFDLNRAIQSTLVLARGEYRYVSDIETEFADLPLITCYGSQINQVVLNVLVNAALAIADRIKDTAERGHIKVTTALEGDDAVIYISDTGSGIPDSIRHRIFEPFFTTKEVGRGTGQGLAIARKVIVQGHGGSMTFHSVPDKGTTFVIRLPVHPQNHEAQVRVA